MTVKGKIKTEDELDVEPDREETYYYTLQEFEGEEGRFYGIMDELHDLGKLIGAIGKTVVNEEKEFKEIESAELEAEKPWHSPEVLKAWHKKTYRQFTYRSLMLLIHTTFEDGMVNLYNTLVAEGRIDDTLTRWKKIPDIMQAL